MTQSVSRTRALTPRWIGAAVIAVAALAACETAPSGPIQTTPDPVVVGEAPPPATLPVEISDPAFTPAHMRGEDTIARIALLLPFTATSEAARGEASQILRAAELALFERAPDNVLILPKDTGGTPEGARSAAQAAVADGADLILGPLFAQSVEAVAEVASEREIPVIAFSTDISVAGDGVYLLSFPPGEEVRRIVDYTAGLGASRYAFIGPANEFGYTVSQAYRAAIEAHTGALPPQEEVTLVIEPEEEVVEAAEEAGLPIPEPEEVVVTRRNGLIAEEFYSGGVQAMNEAAARLARLGVEPLDPEEAARMTGRNWTPSDEPPFQVVILPEGGDRLRTLAPVLIYQDIDPLLIKFVGTGQWRDEDAAREPALNNGWFAGPDPQARARFESAYETIYGNKPSRLAGLGYDAASLAALMAREEAGFTRPAIENPDGFLGVDGLFRFRNDGTIERGLAVYAIRSGRFHVLEPAPERFLSEEELMALDTEQRDGQAADIDPAESF